ncbi:SGNH/GDSL hydrolase family protein [Streptomyces sp. AM 2-1-1]|uniref:SGNH/GDSL hydrolase family protein n=1 Tax=Streptomyces sp. AM 2-1-1 TaxID=3028709 RepID=UPI0023B9B9B6|nr:SGNH/GDSL hydrolase family protein [Streptomyces sp. AM 2-1-1]WEH41516.1 SGNH/GDSL hydrolase family protein [Streptomyces sp. AM 2-1-1]
MARKFSTAGLAVTVALTATLATAVAVGAAGAAEGGGDPGSGRDTTAHARQAGTHWVNTWTSMPQLTEPNNMPPAPFTQDGKVLDDATLRQTVHVSVGGKQVRLRFSNAFGGAALPLTSVSVALPADGRAGARAIRPGTSRTVTFGGSARADVPVGSQIVSDPLDFDVPPGTNLTVTVYLAHGQASDSVTSHPGSRTTSYLLAGDHVRDEDLPGAASTAHWYFLSGVEVWSPETTAAAVIVGDSLTDGRGSTTDANNRWPDQLVERLRSRPDTASTAILNQAAGGNRVLDDGLGPNALSRVDRDVLAQSGVEWALVFEGVNDIGTADATEAAQRRTADALVAAYDQIIVRAHAQGIRVYGATLTPFGGNTGYDDPDGYREQARQKVNAWIRTAGRLDGVVDFDRAARDPRNPRQLLPAYSDADHLHLNPAGYAALAAAVPARLFHREPLPRGFGFD